MENNHSEEPGRGRNPIFSFFILLLFTFVGLFVGNFAGLLSILPFFDFDLMATTDFLSHPTTYPEGRIPLLFVQGVTSVFTFILAPLAYIFLYEKNDLKPYVVAPAPLVPAILLTLLISQSFMFLNTPIIEWNINWEFPEFLSGFEAYAQEQELLLKEITEYLTHFDSTNQFIWAMIIVAVVPGVGEELLFRGLIQQKLSIILRNPHLAIWLAGFLFGLFHFQFYGLIPRMLLGVLFGYLYWWSGSLLLAMVAHFFNNGFTLLMVYLHQNEVVNFDIEGTSEIPSSSILVSGILFVMLFYYFLKFVKHKEAACE